MLKYSENRRYRDRNDIFGIPILGFIFKNQMFLTILKTIILILFVYGIYYGFANPGKENTFTRYLFLGLFWSLFQIVTFVTFGRIFCGICPHAFIGKYFTKIGLQKEMPSWLKNPWWGLLLIIIGWWGVNYTFPGFLRIPVVTATLFTGLTILAFIIYFIFKDMSYCKYLCPIGSVAKAYNRISFTRLGSYTDDCKSCRSFDCTKACPYNLKPFAFNKKNSMGDCSLCMDCSAACESINFQIVKPSLSLFKKFKFDKIEVWTYILITAAITITMSFHHGLGRTKIANDLPWKLTADYFNNFIDFGSINPIGLFSFIYALIITIGIIYIGMIIASIILKSAFNKTFYTLGYAFAPLFIIGGLSHLLETFFYGTYANITNGFIQGFGIETSKAANLASRKDAWLDIFGIFKYLAIIWAMSITAKRLTLFEAGKLAKITAFLFASSFPLFFLFLTIYRSYLSP